MLGAEEDCRETTLRKEDRRPLKDPGDAQGARVREGTVERWVGMDSRDPGGNWMRLREIQS